MRALLQFVVLAVVTGRGVLRADDPPYYGPLSELLWKVGQHLDLRFFEMQLELREIKYMLENQQRSLNMVTNGGWIVIQHRFQGWVNFYRNWTEYRNGFGSYDGDFWLGLENIHALTSTKDYELMIQLEDFNGVRKFARYGKFAIGSEDEGYILKTLESYSGTAGDSLDYQRGKKFTTWDRDNDEWIDGNCANRHNGAWWYGSCTDSNLNGWYKNEESDQSMFWYQFHGGFTGLKISKMMIREV